MITICAQITHLNKDGWRVSVGVPTFFIDENVQCIFTKDGLTRVVNNILNPMKLVDLEINYSAYSDDVDLEKWSNTWDEWKPLHYE